MQKITNPELYRTGLKYFELDEITKAILKPIIAGDDKAEDFESALRVDQHLSRKIIFAANQQLKNGAVQSIAHAVVLIGKNRVRDYIFSNHILNFLPKVEEPQKSTGQKIVGSPNFLKRADETENFSKKLGGDFAGSAWVAGFLFDIIENLITLHPQKDYLLAFFQEEWSHALRTAGLAFHIANISKLSASICRQAFLAGISHDIGRLLLCISYPNECSQMFAEFSQLRATHQWTFESEIEIEKKYFISSHCELSSLLLGMIDAMSEIEEIAHYHHKLGLLRSRGGRLLPVADCLHLADELAEKLSQNTGHEHEQISAILKKNNGSLKIEIAVLIEKMKSLKI
jgi:HD-like signal output (HDOD) protein